MRADKNWKASESTTKLISRISSTGSFRRWHKFVLKRYNNKCTNCGTDKDIEVHHNIPTRTIIDCERRNNYSSNNFYDDLMSNELLFNINNGIVLCERCHNLKHRLKTYVNKPHKQFIMDLI